MHVVFIDDDTFMLKALLRSAKRLRGDWQYSTFDTPSGWQSLLSESIYPDLVICDYLMPDKNGDVVLQELSEVFPCAVRVLLTGDTTEDVVGLASKHAHFVLGKPFSEQDFTKVFQCVERLADLPLDESTRSMLGEGALLIPLPAMVSQIQRHLQSDNYEPHQLADLIAHEPVIAARLLQMANSAFLGFSRQTLSLEEALRRLGLRLIVTIVTAIAIENALGKRIKKECQVEISEKSYQRAVAAKGISELAGFNLELQEQAFAGALLSGIGELVMATDIWQEKFSSREQSYHTGRLSAAMSTYMLTLWGYPESLCEAVFWQHNASMDADGDEALALVLNLAGQGDISELCWESLPQTNLIKRIRASLKADKS